MDPSTLDMIITGALIKDYQDIFQLVSSISEDCDNVVASDDHDTTLQHVSNAYLHLKSLTASIELAIADINNYLEALKPDSEDNSEADIYEQV